MAKSKKEMSKFEWRSHCTEDAGLKHKVGGWFITSKERDQLKSVLVKGKHPSNLPCRLRSMCAYFVDKEVAKCGEFVTSKLAFRLTTWDLDDCEHRYKMRGPPHFETDTHPSAHFLREVYEQAEVKPADFIRKHCLAIPSCHEHETCKEIHSKLPEHSFVNFTCCHRESCTGEFNSTNTARVTIAKYGMPVAARPFSELFELEEEMSVLEEEIPELEKK